MESAQVSAVAGLTNREIIRIVNRYIGVSGGFRHWCLNWESSPGNSSNFGDATGGLEGAQIGGTMRV
jgi:hypothetical protein